MESQPQNPEFRIILKTFTHAPADILHLEMSSVAYFYNIQSLIEANSADLDQM